MTTAEYIESVNKRYQLGNATEHTYRGDLSTLIESLVPGIAATNEPQRYSFGAPDYILTKNDIPVGFIEAKDIADTDLEGKKKTQHKEQFDRYKKSLENLIFTDYLRFRLYHHDEFIMEIAIGKLENGKIVPLPENFKTFENLIKDFTTHVAQTIRSPKKLAEMMAGKARLLFDVLNKSLTGDEESQQNSTLQQQMEAFKQILIHDITPRAFADIYAQTITYGMFAARLHDTSLENFSRQEAAELIPKSNPFLRKLFGYIAGPDIDDRIKWIVDDLAEIFLHCNVKEILKTYGKSTHTEDPIVHFYETFLSEYDPKLRKARGVWYTPKPVVSFIVRAVDEILKTDFGLPQGLADTSKTKIKVKTQTFNKKKQDYGLTEIEVHKVQILDPATGTGTFLAEVVKHIHQKFKGQEGIWSSYVENDLLPRLNGFELLMASYAMAHLKMNLLLDETGFKPTKNERLRVFLTNSLEEYHPDTGTLFASWLSDEAREANRIKRDTPVMVVMGNPPYSGESANKGDWIMNLMEDYKKEPGGKEKLKERNPKWINDDYVKFIRYGQHYIEKNGEGVLAFINPHGFLDNPTFRGMRWNLLKTFDKIYTIDLHGNAKKKETAPDGSVDVNVFDIEQGVSINFFIKNGKKDKDALGKVFHYDLYGKRELKYDFLLENSLKSTPYNAVQCSKPYYFLIPKNFEEKDVYGKGFSISTLFPLNSLGLLTKRDSLSIDFTLTGLLTKIEYFLDKTLTTEHVCKNFKIAVRDKDKWDAEKTRSNVLPSEIKGQVQDIQYRPFDNRMVLYNRYFVARPNEKVLGHFKEINIGLIIGRQGQAVGGNEWNVIFICKNLTDQNVFRRGGGTVFPLYLYSQVQDQPSIEGLTTIRIPNLNMEIVHQIEERLGLKFVSEPFPSRGGVPEGRGGQIPSHPTSHNLTPNPNEAHKGSANPSDSDPISEPENKLKVKRDTKSYNRLPYNPELKERARALRKAGNLSEVLFWNQVKNKKFKGLDFDRQKIIGNYIVDFYCGNCNVVIEIDGSSHDYKQEYDAERDNFLEELGLKIIHIPVEKVMKDMAGLMAWLETHEAFELPMSPQSQSGSTLLSRTGGTSPVVGVAHRPDNDFPKDHPALKGTPPLEGNSPKASEALPNEEVDAFAPIDLLDYIYAVLHSPSYREKYKEFLKIDFPRVPYPTDKETFWKLMELGGQLRQIHLLESPKVEEYITTYPITGTNEITRKITKTSPGFEMTNKENKIGRVWINDEQYFDGVPELAWDFYIGGYQPAQKWLKDRQGRTLSYEDILHYQKIIVALTETDRLMKEIDAIPFLD